jgi:hypothetical protein
MIGENGMRTKGVEKEVPRHRKLKNTRKCSKASPILSAITNHQKVVGGYGKLGRPKIYDPARFPYIAYMLCRERGFTDAELGEVFGVDTETVRNWKRNDENFRKAIADGKDEWDSVHVENALLKRALGYSYQEKTVKKTRLRAVLPDGAKVYLPGEEITITTKQLAPDSKALTFWLTNRQPERWKMINHTKNENTNDGTNMDVSVNADLENLSLEQLNALKEIALMTTDDSKGTPKPPVPDAMLDGLLELTHARDYRLLSMEEPEKTLD